MDKTLITRGLQRAPLPRFVLWIAPWAALFVFGAYAAGLCLVKGLNQTNMDNRFAFGLWIFLDLTVIALGAGAFFTGFLLYILKLKELRAVINSAVVVGPGVLQRRHHHPDGGRGPAAARLVHVLVSQRALHADGGHVLHHLLPDRAGGRVSAHRAQEPRLRDVPSLLVFEFQLHKLTYVLAGVGTFLSFFHQGSLGGLYGVLRGRPFAFREGFGGVAVHLLPVHPFRRGGRAELPDSHHLPGGSHLR